MDQIFGKLFDQEIAQKIKGNQRSQNLNENLATLKVVEEPRKQNGSNFLRARNSMFLQKDSNNSSLQGSSNWIQRQFQKKKVKKEENENENQSKNNKFQNAEDSKQNSNKGRNQNQIKIKNKNKNKQISLDYSQVGMESSKLIQKSKILKEEGEEPEQTENQSYVISLQDEIEQEEEGEEQDEEENEYITQKSLQKQFSNLNLSEQSMISSLGSLINSKVKNKFLNKSHQVQEERPLIKRKLVKGNTQIFDSGIKKIKKVVNILKFKSVFGKVKVKIALRDKKNKLLDKEIEEYQRLNKILDQEEIDITDSDNANVLIDLLHSSHKSNREKNFMKNYIQQIPFFLKFQNQFLSRQETVEKLISHLNHKYYQQRTILMNRGDPGKNFYIILKGGCTVLIPKQKKKDEIQVRKDWKPKLLNTQFFKRVSENLHRAKIVSADRIEQHLFYLYGNFSSAEIGADGYFNQLDKSKQDPKIAKKMKNFKKMALNIGHVSELFNSKKSKKLAFQFLLCPDIKPVQFEKMEYHEFLEKKFPDMMRILEYKSGDSFGEIALLTDGTRQATIVLREDTHFMVLNKTAFRALIGTYNMIIFQENLAFYKQFSFFKLLPESVLNEITKSTISKNFYRNQYIYKEGGDNKYIYFIRYGEVEIKKKMKGENQDQNQVQIQEIDQEFKKINNFKRNKKAQLLAISKLGQNQFFGEKQGEKREEYVQVFSSEIECFLLDKQILYKYLEHYKLLDEFLQFQEQKNNWQEKQEKEVNLIKMNKVNFTDIGQNLEFNLDLKNQGENYNWKLNEKNIKQDNNKNNKLGPLYFEGDKNINDFQNIENQGEEGEQNFRERKTQNQNLNETKDVIFYYNQRKQQQKELQEQLQQKQIKIQELQQQQQQVNSGIQDRKISSNFEQSVKLYQCGKNFQNQSNSNQNNVKFLSTQNSMLETQNLTQNQQFQLQDQMQNSQQKNQQVYRYCSPQIQRAKLFSGSNYRNKNKFIKISQMSQDHILGNNETIQEGVGQIKNMQLSNQKLDKSKTQFSNMDLSKTKEKKMAVMDKIQQESQNSQIIEYKNNTARPKLQSYIKEQSLKDNQEYFPNHQIFQYNVLKSISLKERYLNHLNSVQKEQQRDQDQFFCISTNQLTNIKKERDYFSLNCIKSSENIQNFTQNSFNVQSNLNNIQKNSPNSNQIYGKSQMMIKSQNISQNCSFNSQLSNSKEGKKQNSYKQQNQKSLQKSQNSLSQSKSRNQNVNFPQFTNQEQFSRNSIQKQMPKKSQNFGISQFDSKKFSSIQNEQVNLQSAKKNLNIQFQKYSQNSQELVPLSHRTNQENKGNENLEDFKNSRKFNKNSQKEIENLENENFENTELNNQNNENGQIENELNFSKKKEKKIGFNCKSDIKLNPIVLNPSQSQKLLKSQHFINLGSGHFSKNYYLSENNTKTCINFNNGNSINNENFSESVQNWKNQDQIQEKDYQDEELQSFLMNEISVYKKNLNEKNQNQNQNYQLQEQNKQLEKFSLKNYGRQVRGGRILKEQRFGNQNLRKIRNYHKKFLEEILSERKCQSQTFLRQHSSFQDFKLQGQQKQNQNQNKSQIFENNGLTVKKSQENFRKKEIDDKKQMLKGKNYQIQNQLVQEMEKLNVKNKINNYYSEFIENSQDIKQKKCNNFQNNFRNNENNKNDSNKYRIGNQEGQNIFIEQKQKYDNYYSNKSGIGEIQQTKEKNQNYLLGLQKKREVIKQNESKIEEQKSSLNRNLLFQNGYCNMRYVNISKSNFNRNNQDSFVKQNFDVKQINEQQKNRNSEIQDKNKNNLSSKVINKNKNSNLNKSEYINTGDIFRKLMNRYQKDKKK